MKSLQAEDPFKQRHYPGKVRKDKCGDRADDRANDRAVKAEPKLPGFAGFRLQLIPFFFGLLFGATLYLLLDSFISSL